MNTEKYVVVVQVDDEPPQPPIITSVFGPFDTESEADDWAFSQYVKKGTNLLIIPLSKVDDK